MAFDIIKLARMGEFSMELESLGHVICLSLTNGHLSQANKKLGSTIKSVCEMRVSSGPHSCHKEVCRFRYRSRLVAISASIRGLCWAWKFLFCTISVGAARMTSMPHSA